MDGPSSLQEDDGDQDCVVALLKIDLNPIIRGVATETGRQKNSVFWNSRIALALAITLVFPLEIFNHLFAGISHDDLAGRGAVPCAIGEFHRLPNVGEPGKVTNGFAGHDDEVGRVILPEGYVVAEGNTKNIDAAANRRDSQRKESDEPDAESSSSQKRSPMLK